MSITLYISTVSASKEIRGHQQRITMVLDSKKIEYQVVDISSDEDTKVKMREIVGDPTALPPQICNGDEYCGNYEAFENAVEDGDLQKFLKLES